MYKLAVIAALLAAAAPVALAQTAAPTTASAPAARPNAGALYVQGMMQNGKGDNIAAKASLDEALRLKPDFQPARLMRVSVLSELKETDAALADLDILAPGLPPETVLKMKVDILRDGGRYREAIAVAEALVARTPGDANAWRILGHTRQYSEIDAEMPAALANYDKALQLDPGMLKIYGLRGEILSARGDAKGVERNYREWLAKAPDDPEAHAAYADALARVGKTDKAKAEIDRALALKPSAQAYLARAGITPNDQHDAILADIDKALALEPDSTFAYQLRARKRAGWGQSELAMADIEKALELWPDSFGARETRAELNRDAGRYDLAIKDLDILVARAPNQPVLLNDRCWIRALANKELDLAMADCEASLKIAQDPATIDSRAFVKLRKGDLRGSIADYDAALKLKSDLPASLFGRGVAKRRSGDTVGGDADLAKARKLAPEIDKRFAGYGVTP